MFVLSPARSDHTHVTTHSVHSKSPSHAPRPNHVIESVSNYNYSQRDLVHDSNQIMQFFLPPYTFIQAAKLVAALTIGNRVWTTSTFLRSSDQGTAVKPLNQ